MAIPFNVPSDEYTLEQYRRIHQLLLDLMDLLRGLNGYVGLPPQYNTNQNTNAGSSSDVNLETQGQSTSSSSQLQAMGNLPDVVTSTLQGVNINNSSSNGSRPSADLGSYFESDNSGDSCRELVPEIGGVPVPSSRRKSLTRRGSFRLRGKFTKRKKEKVNENKDFTTDGGVLLHAAINCACFQCHNYHAVKQEDLTDSKISICSCESNKLHGSVPNTTKRNSKMCDLVAGTMHSESTEIVFHRIDRGSQFNCDHNIENDGRSNSHNRNRLTAHSSPGNQFSSWTQIGEDLHRITEAMKTTFGKDDDQFNNYASGKESILSVLPNQFGRTMIATALIYIGWKLLRQS